MTSIAQIERVYAARQAYSPYRPKGLIVQCCACKKVKLGKTVWGYVPIPYGASVSSSLCPTCEEKGKTGAYKDTILALRKNIERLEEILNPVNWRNKK
jgi:hypothetical protein